MLQLSSEHLSDLDQQISKIQNQIKSRKQKTIEWSVPYSHVLQSKLDPQVYLRKKLNSDRIDYHEKVLKSRKKIKNNGNQLKQLDQLIKKRQKIRKHILESQIYTQDKENQNLFDKHQDNNNVENSRKEQIFRRNLKNRVNPFLNFRPQNLVQYFEGKKNKLNSENSQQLTKIVGIGIQSTPIYLLMNKEEQKNGRKIQSKQRTRKNKLQKMNQFQQQQIHKKPKMNLPAMLNKQFINENRNKFLHIDEIRPNIFQNKFEKIMKQHGFFWKQNLFKQ